jgi:hypothetical protein
MRHAETLRTRSRNASAKVVALIVIGFAVLLAPSRARADFDITNDWVVSLNLLPGPTAATCTWAFQQTGGTFSASGSCGAQTNGGLQGTIDVASGAIFGTGSIMSLSGPEVNFFIAGNVAASGTTITATVAGVVTGSLTATLCRNGHLDPGEACDEGFTQGGCCTSCTLKADGTSCGTWQQCQSAPSCSAGACIGTPLPEGTSCDANGTRCTVDACDGAGSCVAGPCSPCCGGPTCRPQPRFGACQRQTAASLIDVQTTPLGAKDKIVWNVPHVEATSVDDLPDPATTPYAVCFYTLDSYDEFSFLSYDVVAPTAQSCGRPNCWKKGLRGVTYNGGSLKPGGAASLRVNTGVDGKAKLSFVGKGPELGLDPLPSGLAIFGGELLVELHAGDSCWSSQYFNLGYKPSIRTNARYRMKGGQ